MSDILLEVRDLQTWFDTRSGIIRSVNGVDLTLKRGEILGLVGESGSGKSVTGYSIMGLLEAPGRIAGGSIKFYSKNSGALDLVNLPEERLRALRGDRIAMIFQDPATSLNPVLRVDTQMREALHSHARMSSEQAHGIAREALNRVGIAAPDERLKSYPHQFSGGMRQRVAIATAILNKPELIIADEPTTALDVTVQAQILYEVKKLCRESGTALIWITHDLSLVSGLADKIAVMYAGRIVESGPIADVMAAPRHPYTIGLMKSIPSNNPRGQPLYQIPGMAPSAENLPTGCAFRPRCERASAECERIPAARDLSRTAGVEHMVRCFHAEEVHV
ncbi:MULTISPECIES: ABC transporter ATP-binding protein [unclassified Herbaspirillum]|uniref:ABC transporter ATP-binding protein n=1 Tax=unclassified Herbaspirillum TaxID=2624150 RepID=UPI000E2F10F6|nr:MULTISPECIES: ABC transporter ATP-binding protein [unclassified Herbaspirillum]RFB71173.1 ABC transporter ATP-binding protein [Herbaspirillum sp. 3R-3a1]TFI08296.1 ABC transporter ATP-binding protein [Herbaspirillum sp. 3R11]TFI14711.1 ABC transporter ATP-binding protein [Herbaspirillum sp. 3R-11]TFI31897.1 ABC transporter ATP-binding protein [Herbaspirillum sp. 3C11]TFI32020.1 ABC transporter ATP-binding protein [Herbaspirillum sp. 3C11]